jgi:hypothetical protein
VFIALTVIPEQGSIDRGLHVFISNLQSTLCFRDRRSGVEPGPAAPASRTRRVDPNRADGVARAVEAQCVEGFLMVSRPRARSLRPTGGWADRLKAPPFNLFYGDMEADAEARLSSRLGRPVHAILAPPITRSIAVRSVPVRPID